eukprot:Lithocolla_globosa_v1_NODE_349_length_4370_cov_18.560371.p8 type:complete len:108 gc:universal NODE_349_length_4370_cov_18.560371:512-189(-)
MAVEMHPFIHPPEQPLNRPNHNHHYIKTTDIHQHYTRLSAKNMLYIPNQCNYSQSRQLNHTLALSTQKHSHIWNTLPEKIKTEKNLKKFKKILKNHLLEEQAKTTYP